MNRRILILLTSFVLVLSLPLSVHAGGLTVNIVPANGPANDIKNIAAPGIVSTIINILLGGAGVLSFIYLLMGGWGWIMAGGDKDAVERARKKITGALIGLALVFSSYAMIYLVRSFYGVNITSVEIRPIP